MVQGSNKFYINALGCLSNRVDTARVQNFLISNNWVQTDQIKDASLVVLMTCGFTQNSEDHNIAQIVDVKEKMRTGAQLIVGGCLTAINSKRVKAVHDGLILTPRSLDKLNDHFATKTLFDTIIDARADVPNSQDTKLIKISTGCMGSCTYCAIRFANGRTQSRKIDSIILDIKRSSEEGYRYVKLVSEDVGAYGQDQGISVVDLLKAILSHDDNVSVFVDCINPNWVHRYKDELLDLFSSDRVMKSFFTPIQSGSNRILRLMNRAYTVEEAREVMSSLYGRFPNVKISGDFIVGFPSETNADFEETRKLLNDYNFDFIEIFSYEDRPGTKASKLKEKIPVGEKEERRIILFQDFLKGYIKKHKISSYDDLMAALKLHGIPINFNVDVGGYSDA